MQAGARFLRFRRKKNHQKINQKSMQNKSEKMIGKFQQKYQFWDGFGKGFGRVWEGLEGIKIRWKKDVKIRGRGAQLLIAALGHDLYRGGLGCLLAALWSFTAAFRLPGPSQASILKGLGTSLTEF